MMPRGVRHAFTLFELLLALALLAALSSLVVGVLLRTDRDHDLLQGTAPRPGCRVPQLLRGERARTIPQDAGTLQGHDHAHHAADRG